MKLEERFNGLIELLKQNNVDAVFLAPSSDLKYVTGLDMRSDSRLKGLVVTKRGASFFLCPSLHRDDVGILGERTRIVEWHDGDGFRDAFREGMREAGLTTGSIVAFSRGIEAGDMIDLLEGASLKCVNGFSLLSPMRSVKSKEEQVLMRNASLMNDRMMEALTNFLRPGLFESEIMKFIMNFHESCGGKPRVPAVCTGVNSAKPHYGRDNDRAIEERDIVMVDCGGWYDGYSHDMTRTFFIGEPSEEQRRVYEAVLDAQTAAVLEVRAGAIPAEIDRTARDIIGKAGYADAFNHRLGHGIGMDGHEAPYISSSNRVPLVEGNCFSIEPGIYLTGKFGVRIEDLMMLTESGPEILNHFPKEIIIL
jgi:Xaa-Pro dipeptidase